MDLNPDKIEPSRGTEDSACLASFSSILYTEVAQSIPSRKLGKSTKNFTTGLNPTTSNHQEEMGHLSL